MTRRSPISGSAKCSKKLFLGISGFSRAAVKVLVAAALLLCASGPVSATVKVEGVPSWLEQAATRSVEAVWREIDPRQDESNRLLIIKLVATRLFEGYSVDLTEISGENLKLVLKAKNVTAWKVEGGMPPLAKPLSEWMDEDWQEAGRRIGALVSGLPLEALNWADSALRLEVAGILRESLPGWQGSLVVRIEGDRSVLKVGLVPEQPLVLAVNPRTNSTSLPTLLHSDVKEDLLTGLSPIIGLPVAWIASHEGRVAEWAAFLLGDESFVENLKVDVKVTVKPQPVTDLAVRLESRRYTIWAWVAGYAGTSDRYPEAGLHLGRKAQLLPHWDVELYGEAIFFLNDWDLETRLGLRWSPWDRIWVGAERSWPDEATWWRVWFDGPVRSPYAWIRGSEEGNVNFGIGYRLNEYLSIELHYDDRDDNSSSVRLVGNL
jgi:hypothetical protein